MIIFPNIKINLGLNIISKRPDGYHNIETVFYPVNINDIIEVVESNEFDLINHGIKIDCELNQNLCVKAYNILQKAYNLPPVKIIIYKNVPLGSGLGSGSSDAAHTLKLLNTKFNLNLSNQELIKIASSIGADCAFFIENKPVLAKGTGNIFSHIKVSLDDYYLLIAFPGIKVSTPEAYANCNPAKPKVSLEKAINKPIDDWKVLIKNDFEETIFLKHPLISEIKKEFYEFGAIYAQMSGSGSSVFGIFKNNPKNITLKNCKNIRIIKL